MNRFLLLLLFISSFGLRAQTDAPPITAAVQTLPPFTPNLSDWSDPLNDKVQVTLLLNDRAQPGFQVDLRLTIEGQGVRLQSSQDWSPTPIALSYGIPTQLTGVDLVEYFDLDHLIFSGISREQYLTQGGLPEGTYSICVEAFPVIRTGEGAASLVACSFVQARLLDPPVILSPLGMQTPISPQLLLVQWQARHTASFLTDYTLEIYQEDPTLTPEQVYALQQPYVETQLSGMTSVTIDVSFPTLQRGDRYFARVRAEDPMGSAVFKNAGYSELAFFTYGEACEPPSGINADVNSHDRANVTWNFQSGSGSYILRYREQNELANWYEESTFFNQFSLEGLSDSTTYEVQLQSVCGDTPGAFSPVYEFTTLPLPFDANSIDCGEEIEALPLPTNQTPIATLAFGVSIQVGQFKMKVTRANDNGDGTWAGVGQINIPWIGQRLNCTFDKLKVNTEKAVFGGIVRAIDKGLASVDGFLTDEEIATMMDTATVNFCGQLIPVTQDSTINPPPPADTLPPPPSPPNTYADLAAFAGGTSLPFVLGAGTERIAFYNMVFTPTGAKLDAYSSARIPLGDRFVAFGAAGVGFQPGGIQGESKLALLADIAFDWSGKMRFTVTKSGNNYIAFDCSGVTEIGLEARIDFCRDLMVPVDPATAVADADGFANATFTAVATSWSDFAGEVNISPFELPQLPGWAFTVQDAVLDFSGGTTPNSVVFPTGYSHPNVAAGTGPGGSPAWEGFYLGQARVRVPEQFLGGSDSTSVGRDSTEALAIGVSGLIIDKTGFSGSIFGENILTLDQGRAGAWALSLDSIAITVMNNQFKSTNLSGRLEVPVFDNPLAYNCHIQPGGKYAFSVAVKDTISMSAMVASFSLYENTEIGIEYDEQKDEFSAYAKLYGQASFSPALGGGTQDSLPPPPTPPGELPPTEDNLVLAAIDFQDFHVSSKAPYIINIGSWALSANTNEDQPVAAGFPLQLKEASMIHDKDKNQVAFGLALTLNLVRDTTQGFGAYGRAFIICDVNVDPVSNKQVWAFNRVRLDKLKVDYVGAGFELHGFIENFENNPLYGTGFNGGIQASFKPGIAVAATVLFGKKDDYRYFFADALVAFTPGIPLGPSGMAVYGFGGGVSYHMERQGFAGLELPASAAVDAGSGPGEDSNTTPTDPPTYPLPTDPPPGDSNLEDALKNGDPAAAIPPGVPLPSQLGASLSGVTYVPNKNIGIGIKAMVAFGTVQREVFNGDITLEVIFNDDGGMNYIGLAGNANFITPPPTPAEPTPQAAISAYVDMGFDFENDAFSAYLRMKAYIAGGLIQGAYPNAVAGEGSIYADDDKWYIYLGTPDQPIKLSFDLSALANVGGNNENTAPDSQNPPVEPPPVDSTRAPLGTIGDVGLLLSAYLDAGTALPAFPDPPANVTDMLGDSKNGYNPTSRDDPRFANAAGLLFGAKFDLSMPELNFLIFYAYINAGIGFDMMLQNYGTNSTCANLSDSPSPIGMNGWYATGQFYAYLNGGVGIKIDLFGFKGRYEIFDVGVAALLQARLPNPMWMKGQMAGQYSLLGGLISGNCNFEFEAGTVCDISEEGSLANIKLIESITPSQAAEDVSVFNKPQALLAIPIDNRISLKDENGDYIDLKPVLREFTVTDVTSNTTVPGTLEWNNEKTVVAFRPDDILGGERPFSLKVKVDLLKQVGESWVPLVIDGEQVTNVKTISFTTGVAPDHIVEDNVRYAYPINRQLNFHRNEAGTGYVKLDQGQDYLFLSQPGCTLDPNKWAQRISFVQDDNIVSSTTFTYNGSSNQLNFSIPSGQLQDGKVSYLQVVNTPIGQDALDVDANVTEIERDLAENLPEGASADNATTVLLATREASGSLNELKQKLLYRLDFRTSYYATFPAKAAAIASQQTYVSPQALTTPPDTIINDDDGTYFIGPYLSIDDFGKIVLPTEEMDVFDLKGEQSGSKKIEPLIRGEANLAATANNWYTTHPKPNLYDRFPQPALGIDLKREADLLGEPPVRAIKLLNQDGLPLSQLTDAAISNGLTTADSRPLVFGYHLPYVMYKDFVDYYNQVSNYSLNNNLPAGLQSFLDWQFVYPGYGDYEIQLQYFLPGKTAPNSSFTTQLPYNVQQFNK